MRHMVQRLLVAAAFTSGIQYTAAGMAVTSFGQPTGAYAARQAQVGMRLDW
ncbi:MAG: hypothetical protein ABI664_09275 [bacterium]